MIKFRKIIFYLMIPVTLMLFLAGIIYYASSGLSPLAVILCTLDNTVKSFLGRPTIPIFNAFRSIDDSYSVWDRAVVYLYGVVSCIAPILTTGALVSGLQAYMLDFWHSIKLSKKKKLLIIGDGSSAQMIAQKYAEKYDVSYLMPESTQSNARLSLLKKGIDAYPVDYHNISEYLPDIRMVAVSAVALNFDDWFASHKVASNVIEYLVQNVRNGKMPLHIIDAPKLYSDIFDSIYRGYTKKHNKSEDIMTLHFDNVNEYNAKLFFKDPQLTQQPDNRHHIVILGLGNCGRAILNELSDYMVENGLWGTIEVFDRSLNHKMNDLIYSQEVTENAELFQVIDTAENAALSIRMDTKAGPITANYYEIKIGELSYLYCIDNIVQKEPITEWFFCVDNLSVNFECYRMLQSMIDDSSNVRVYFRISSDMKDFMEAIELHSDKYKQLPDNGLDINFEETDR